ncbi:hypothetical protein [Defluviimonas sp. WL0075]|uniref:hypothetical protein n=1 Tax=Albidovulum sediminicola TaxID=2984331 RepID=UPI0021E7FFD7|nr:hypothetical protein [Defluviimonas sp. WL0075]
MLCSCGASPAPQFFNSERHEVTLEGIDFVVFRKGDRAEVVRLGYLGKRARDPVPRLMEEAIERTTGCRARPGSKVTGLPGDTGEARFDLDCPE